MRTFDTPYIADWYAISLRWLTLLGMVVTLVLGGMFFSTASWLLGGLILWNMVMSILAGLNVRISYHRQISLAIDLLVVGFFFWLQGGLYGPVFWAGLLPILIGAIYFEFWGALTSAILFSALEVCRK